MSWYSRRAAGVIAAALTFIFPDDDQALERHTKEAEDLMRAALAGHAAMYDVEISGRRAPVDSFPPA